MVLPMAISVDDIVLDLEKYLHDVATGGIANLADTVGIFNFPDIAGVGEMIHDFVGVHNRSPSYELANVSPKRFPDQAVIFWMVAQVLHSPSVPQL